MGWVCEAAGRGPGHMLVPLRGAFGATGTGTQSEEGATT